MTNLIYSVEIEPPRSEDLPLESESLLMSQNTQQQNNNNLLEAALVKKFQPNSEEIPSFFWSTNGTIFFQKKQEESITKNSSSLTNPTPKPIVPLFYQINPDCPWEIVPIKGTSLYCSHIKPGPAMVRNHLLSYQPVQPQNEVTIFKMASGVNQWQPLRIISFDEMIVCAEWLEPTTPQANRSPLPDWNSRRSLFEKFPTAMYPPEIGHGVQAFFAISQSWKLYFCYNLASGILTEGNWEVLSCSIHIPTAAAQAMMTPSRFVLTSKRVMDRIECWQLFVWPSVGNTFFMFDVQLPKIRFPNPILVASFVRQFSCDCLTPLTLDSRPRIQHLIHSHSQLLYTVIVDDALPDQCLLQAIDLAGDQSFYANFKKPISNIFYTNWNTLFIVFVDLEIQVRDSILNELEAVNEPVVQTPKTKSAKLESNTKSSTPYVVTTLSPNHTCLAVYSILPDKSHNLKIYDLAFYGSESITDYDAAQTLINLYESAGIAGYDYWDITITLRRMLRKRKYLAQTMLLILQSDLQLFSQGNERSGSVFRSIALLENIKSVLFTSLKDQYAALIESQAKIWMINLLTMFRSLVPISKIRTDLYDRLETNPEFDLASFTFEFKLKELLPFAEWIIHLCAFFFLNLQQLAQLKDQKFPPLDDQKVFNHPNLKNSSFNAQAALYLFSENTQLPIPFLGFLFEPQYLLYLQELLAYAKVLHSQDPSSVKTDLQFYELLTRIRNILKNHTNTLDLGPIAIDLSKEPGLKDIRVRNFPQSPAALFNFLDLVPINVNFLSQSARPTTIQLLEGNHPLPGVRPQDSSLNSKNVYDVVTRRVVDRKDLRQCTRCHRVSSGATKSFHFSDSVCPICQGAWRVYQIQGNK